MAKKNRSSTELLIDHLKQSQLRMAKSLPHILALGHTVTGHEINGMIATISDIIGRFETVPTDQPLLNEAEHD